MTFTLKYYYDGFYPYFTLPEKMSDREFRDFIGVLQALIDMDRPFVFLVDVRKLTKFNTMYCGWEVVKWMKKNKAMIRKNLRGSAVVLSNKTVSDILNWIFEKQPPVSPNVVTLKIEEGIDFIEDKIPENLRKKS